MHTNFGFNSNNQWWIMITRASGVLIRPCSLEFVLIHQPLFVFGLARVVAWNHNFVMLAKFHVIWSSSWFLYMMCGSALTINVCLDYVGEVHLSHIIILLWSA